MHKRRAMNEERKYRSARQPRHRVRMAGALVVVLGLLGGCVTGGLFGPDYAAILENSAGYTERVHHPDLDFGYQEADDPRLVRLRETYDLETMAGSGADRERIIRLMEWVFERVPHDGRSSPPAWNTFDIVRYHEQTGRGVNCRKLAIALTEVYLSMGYRARYVTCKPQPAEFSDCHVVSVVWAPDEERWMMMDPSFRAYVTDATGAILGVEEFREALRTGASISLSSDASLHGAPYPESSYFRYMTKNLYRYEVPTQISMGYEAPGNDTSFIEVVPTGYARPGTYTGMNAAGSRWTHAITDNPAEVWDNL